MFWIVHMWLTSQLKLKLSKCISEELVFDEPKTAKNNSEKVVLKDMKGKSKLNNQHKQREKLKKEKKKEFNARYKKNFR